MQGQWPTKVWLAESTPSLKGPERLPEFPDLKAQALVSTDQVSRAPAEYFEVPV